MFAGYQNFIPRDSLWLWGILLYGEGFFNGLKWQKIGSMCLQLLPQKVFRPW
jgi:hypothetical protein